MPKKPSKARRSYQKQARQQTGYRVAEPAHGEQWSSLLEVKPRFLRSVHLSRDLDSERAFDGYQLTPLVASVLSRISSGLEDNSHARAWSVTGPFGSGKSALALLLAQAFAPPTNGARMAARQLVGYKVPALGERLFKRGALIGQGGLVPVVAVGDRRSLASVLLESLHTTLEERSPSKQSDLVKRVNALARRAKNEPVPAREVADLFVQASAFVRSSGSSERGLLVLLDEAGKTLEHAALNPSVGDVLLLQELGEAAARSGESPLVFVVLLHQSFDRYAGRLGSTDRHEWAKVQGRFEDIPFQEANEQLLHLIGEALHKVALPASLESKVAKTANLVARLAKLPGLKAQATEALLKATAPLHPVTSLTLGILFRSRVFQNERSLFAFLASNEPHGFGEFKRRPIDLAAPLYSIDQLYDYVVTTLGPRIYSAESQAWAQTEAALRRLPHDASAMDVRVLKAVGMLAALGEATGLVPSEGVLSAALTSGRPDAGHEDVVASILRLESASLMVHRRYRDAYQIWEGSDLDLNALVRDAGSRLDPGSSLTNRLERMAKPRPVAARRHFFKTGTLRYFEVRFSDGAVLADSLQPLDPGADGVIFLALPATNAATEAIRAALNVPGGRAQLQKVTRPTLIALPRDVDQVRGLALDLASLEWVQANTPQLQSDPVARRELTGRIAEADRLLKQSLAMLLGGGACSWHHSGGDEIVRSSRDLARLVSDLCDQFYQFAPHIHNELLNRRSLSSAAAAARRSLVEAMVDKNSLPQLGIEGTPPELSMYRSLLEHHGLHRSSGETAKLSEPKRMVGGLKSVYEKIQEVLDFGGGARLTLDRVYEVLRAPPYGLKDGPLPVLLIAVLLESGADVAIYEDGAFVPLLTSAIAERMLRGPSKFEVQRFRVAGARADLFQQLIGPDLWASGKVKTLLPLVKQLVRVVRDLPDYSRNTRSLSAHALAVREALLRAKEPGPLIFTDLPRACGFDPLLVDSEMSKEQLAELGVRLRAALRELQAAYPSLLGLVQASLRSTFSLPNDLDASRKELSGRAKVLAPLAIDTQLKGFLIRAADDGLDRDAWLESLATLLGGRPPATWHDREREAFSINLAQVSRRFSTVEAFAVESGNMALTEGTKLLRLSVSEPGALDQERVVAIRAEESRSIAILTNELRQLVQGQQDISKDAVLAALAYVARDLVGELSAPDETRAGGAAR